MSTCRTDNATRMSSFDIGHVASVLQDIEMTEQDKFSQLKELKSVLSKYRDGLLDNTTVRYLCRALLDCFSNHSSLGLAEEAVFMLGRVIKLSCSTWEPSTRAEVLGTCVERVVDVIESTDRDSNRLHTAHNLLQHIVNLDSKHVVAYLVTNEGYEKLKSFIRKCVELASEDEVEASVKIVALQILILALKGDPAFILRIQNEDIFWVLLLFPLLFSLKSWRLRAVMMEIFKILTNCKLCYAAGGWETLKQDIKEKYVPAMLELVGSEDWCDLWCLTIEVVENELLAERSTQDVATIKLFNCLLSVPEKAFKSADPATRLQAFNSWKWLIEKFSLKGVGLLKRKLKLLTQPLLVRNDKTSEIYRKKIEVWWCLIRCLGKEIWSCLDSVVISFLKFCFGIVGGQPFLAPRTLSSTPEKSPGKKEGVLSHWKLDSMNHPILIFVLSELLKIGSSTAQMECINNFISLKPLSVPIVESTKIFLHLAHFLIFSVGECILLIAKVSEHDQKVRPLWSMLLWHVCSALSTRRCLEVQDKVVEVVKDVERVLRGLVDQAKAVPTLVPYVVGPLLEEILEGPHKLPLEVLVNHIYDAGSTDLMNGTPALFLIELLLSPSLLFTMDKELRGRYRVLWKSVVQLCIGARTAGSLQFVQAVVKRLDAAIQDKLVCGELALRLWQAVAKQLLKFMVAGGDVNQGSDMCHDFLCVYSVLLFPLHHHHQLASVDQVDKLMDVWSHLYSVFMSQAHQCSSVDVNEVGEFVSGKICSVLRKATLTAPQLLVFASAVKDIVNSIPFSTISQMPSKKRSTPLMRSKSEKPLANVSSVLHMVSSLLSCLKGMEKWEELCSQAAAMFAQSVSCLFKMGSPSNAEALFLQLAPMVTSLLELPAGTPDLADQLRRLWTTCVEFVHANTTHLTLPKVSDSLITLTSAALVSCYCQIKRDALKFATETVHDLFKSKSATVPVTLTKAVELCRSDEDVFFEDDENSQSNLKQIKLAGSFLAKINDNDVQVHKSQESSKALVKSATVLTPLKKTAQVTVLKGSPSTPLSLKKKPLTAHQKEMMRKRRDDIPALYEDLSQETQLIDSQEESMSLETVPLSLKPTISQELGTAGNTKSQNEVDAVCYPVSSDKSNPASSDKSNPASSDKSFPNTGVDSTSNNEENKFAGQFRQSVPGTVAESRNISKETGKSLKDTRKNNLKKSTGITDENSPTESCKNQGKKELSKSDDTATELVVLKTSCNSSGDVAVTQNSSEVEAEKEKCTKSKSAIKKLSKDEGRKAVGNMKSKATKPTVSVKETAVAEMYRNANEEASVEPEAVKPIVDNDNAVCDKLSAPSRIKVIGSDSVANSGLSNVCRTNMDTVKISSLRNGICGGKCVAQNGEAVATELTKLLNVISCLGDTVPSEMPKKNVVVEKVPSELLPDGLLSSAQCFPTEKFPGGVSTLAECNSTVSCTGKSRGRRKLSRPVKNNPYRINFKNCMYLTKPVSPVKRLRSRKITSISPKSAKVKKLTKTERDANQLFVNFVSRIGVGNEVIDQRNICIGVPNGLSLHAVPISESKSESTCVDAKCQNEQGKMLLDDEFSALTDALASELSKPAFACSKGKTDMGNTSSVQKEVEIKSGTENSCTENDNTSQQADISSRETAVEKLKDHKASHEVAEKKSQETSNTRRSSRISRGVHSRNLKFMLDHFSSHVKFVEHLQNKSVSESTLINESDGKSSPSRHKTVHEAENVMPSFEKNQTTKVTHSKPNKTSAGKKCNNVDKIITDATQSVEAENINCKVPEVSSMDTLDNSAGNEKPVDNGSKKVRVGRKRTWSSASGTKVELCEHSSDPRSPEAQHDNSLERGVKPKHGCEQCSDTESKTRESIDAALPNPSLRKRGRPRKIIKLYLGKRGRPRKYNNFSKTSTDLPKSFSVSEGEVNNVESIKNIDESCIISENKENVLHVDELQKKAECLECVVTGEHDASSVCASVKRKLGRNKDSNTIPKNLKNQCVLESNSEASNIVQGTLQEQKQMNIASTEVEQGNKGGVLGKDQDCNKSPNNAEVICGNQLEDNGPELKKPETIHCKSSTRNNKNGLADNLKLQTLSKNVIVMHNSNKTVARVCKNKTESMSPVKSSKSKRGLGPTSQKMGGRESVEDSVIVPTKCLSLFNHKSDLAKDEKFSQDIIDSSQDVEIQDFVKILNLRKCSVTLNGLTVVDNKIIDPDKNTVVALASDKSFTLSPSYKSAESCVSVEPSQVSPARKKINFDEGPKSCVQVECEKQVENLVSTAVESANSCPRTEADDNANVTDELKDSCHLQKSLKNSKKKIFSLRNISYSVMKSKSKDLKCVVDEHVNMAESKTNTAESDAKDISKLNIRNNEGVVSPSKPASRSERMLSSVQMLLRRSSITVTSNSNLVESPSPSKLATSALVDQQVKLPIGKLNNSVSIFVTRNVALDTVTADSGCDDVTNEKQDCVSPVKCSSSFASSSSSPRLSVGEVSSPNRSHQLLRLKSRSAQILSMTKTEPCLEETPQSSDVAPPDERHSSTAGLRLDEGVIAHSPDGKVRMKEWKKHTYSPGATPRNSSLKRMREEVDSISPPAKKKSVSFSDPPRSTTLVFSRVVGEMQVDEVKRNTRPRRRVPMYGSVGEYPNIDGLSSNPDTYDVSSADQSIEENSCLESQGSVEEKFDRLVVEPNKTPIYEALRDSREPIKNIAKVLVPKLWAWKLEEFFERCNIKTVGDMAALPSWIVEDGSGSFLDPICVRKVLKDFEAQQLKNADCVETSDQLNEACSTEIEETVESTKTACLDEITTSGNCDKIVSTNSGPNLASSNLMDVCETRDDCEASSVDCRTASSNVCEPMSCDPAVLDADGPSHCDTVAVNADKFMLCDQVASDNEEPMPCDSVASDVDGAVVCNQVASDNDEPMPCDSFASDVDVAVVCDRVASDNDEAMPCDSFASDVDKCTPCDSLLSEVDGSTSCGVVASNAGKPTSCGTVSLDSGKSNVCEPVLLDPSGVVSSDSSDDSLSDRCRELPKCGGNTSATSVGACTSPESADIGLSVNAENGSCHPSPVVSKLDLSHDGDISPTADESKTVQCVSLGTELQCDATVAESQQRKGGATCSEECRDSHQLGEEGASRQSVFDRLEMALGILKSIPRELVHQRVGDILVVVGDMLSGLGLQLNLS